MSIYRRRIYEFWIIGIIIFETILSLVVVYLEKRYQQEIIIKINKMSLIRIIYPFLLGYIFFILRGDLLSSLSYVIRFTAPYISVYMGIILLTSLSLGGRKQSESSTN